MNWTSIFSGTDWSHAVGFCVAAIVLVSLTSIAASRLLHNHPTLRHGILLSALVACLLVPIVGLVTGSTQSPILAVPVAVRPPSEAESVSEWPKVNPNASESEITLSLPSDAAHESSSLAITVPSAVQQTFPSTLVDEASGTRTYMPAIWSIIPFLWCLGTSVLLLFALRSYRRGWSMRLRSKIVDSDRNSQCCRAAQQRTDLNWLPAIMQSDEVYAPVVHGFRNPVVILPASLNESISRNALTDVLVHEFAHVRRRDTMVVIAEVLARALFWPIVTIHLLIRDLGRSREEVCDNFVLADRDSVQYAETLLKLAEFAGGRTAAIHAVGILHWRGAFEKRVAGLLDGRRSRSRTLPPSIAIGLAMLFVLSGVALTGSRLVATEVADEAQPENAGKPAAEQKDVAEHAVRVVDWQGNPVAGAKVELWLLGFSAEGSGGGNRPPRKDAFAGLTDADGRIDVPYPKGGQGEIPTTSLYLAVEHPNHPRWSKGRKLTATDEIKLSRPVFLSITASLSSDDSTVTSDLYAMTQERKMRWSMKGGKLESGPVDVSANRLLVVHAPKDGPTSFSEVIDLSNRTISGNRVSINAVLDRSVELRGRLDDDIPLPIRGGRVIAMSSPSAGNSWATWWSTTTTISEDGGFVLENLPPRRHVQLIALCDGGVSRSPRPSEVKEYCRVHDYNIRNYNGVTAGKTVPQLYFAAEDSREVVIPMDPTGDVEVTVEDWDSKPIANVEIQFGPNQRWYGGGNQMLGSGFDSREFLKKAASGKLTKPYRDLASRTTKKHEAVTDKDGKAVVRDLPAGVFWYEFDGREQRSQPFTSFTATHDAYALVPKEPQRIHIPGVARETVDMISGGMAKIRVRMERKNDPDSVITAKAAEKRKVSELNRDITIASNERPKSANIVAAAKAAQKSKHTTKPITVSGFAKDLQGAPVANAKIHLISVNRISQAIGTTTTEGNGRYVFENVAMPVPADRNGGTIDVYGTAEGFGLTWHGMRFVTFGERRANRPKGPEDHSFFENEPIVLDLEFPPAAKLFGQVLDGDKQPVVNAKINIGNLDYLDTKGRTMHHNYREFWGLRHAPEKFRVARTDADGNFEISNLPQDSVAWLNISHDHFARQSLYAAITDRKITQYTFISKTSTTIRDGKQVKDPIFETKSVAVSPLAIKVAASKSISIRVVDEQGNPLPEISVSVSSGGRATGTSAYGKSDTDGNVHLSVPPAEYRLSLRPPRTSDRVPTYDKLTVSADDEANQQRTITLPLGCVLIFKAIDSESGKPLQGVSFWREMDEKRGRTGLNTSPVYVDHPVTNEEGELTAVVMPGKRAYGVGWSKMPADYRGGSLGGRTVDCKSGATNRITFELRKQK